MSGSAADMPSAEMLSASFWYQTYMQQHANYTPSTTLATTIITTTTTTTAAVVAASTTNATTPCSEKK